MVDESKGDTAREAANGTAAGDPVAATATDASGESADTAGAGRGQKESLLHKLYVGTGAFNIVGNRRRWFMMFGTLIVVCIIVVAVRGFNFGIDFVGGTQIQFPGQSTSGSISTEQVSDVYDQVVGKSPEEIQQVGTGNLTSIQIRSEKLDHEQVVNLKQSIFQQLQPVGTNGKPDINSISISAVSGSWGGQVSQQALIALGVFLVLVGVFLAIYFERWMAIAALLALMHDVFVTAGIYALVGLEVTPATVIGLLTVLGFSLYDTVVVFDKVKENTRGLLGLTRRTYGEAANLALNQTMMRSINTTVIAILPVLGLLIVGYLLLGAGTLQQLALVQLIGMVVGVASSVLLATPLLVAFKMRDQTYRDHAGRVEARRKKVREQKAAEDTGVGGMDSDELAGELRQEAAMAAAAGVPARHPKSSGPQRGRTQDRGGQPRGKPTGKRNR